MSKKSISSHVFPKPIPRNLVQLAINASKDVNRLDFLNDEPDYYTERSRLHRELRPYLDSLIDLPRLHTKPELKGWSVVRMHIVVEKYIHNCDIKTLRQASDLLNSDDGTYEQVFIFIYNAYVNREK